MFSNVVAWLAHISTINNILIKCFPYRNDRKHDYDCGAGITAAVDTTSLKAAGRNTMTRTRAIEHRKDHGVDSHRPLEMTVGGTTGQ